MKKILIALMFILVLSLSGCENTTCAGGGHPPLNDSCATTTTQSTTTQISTIAPVYDQFIAIEDEYIGNLEFFIVIVDDRVAGITLNYNYLIHVIDDAEDAGWIESNVLLSVSEKAVCIDFGNNELMLIDVD